MNRDKIIRCLKSQGQVSRTQFNVIRLALFGSAARDELTLNSDVDILVEFDGPATFDGYMDLKFRLEEFLGREVDLVTNKAVREELKTAIERDLVNVA